MDMLLGLWSCGVQFKYFCLIRAAPDVSSGCVGFSAVGCSAQVNPGTPAALSAPAANDMLPGGHYLNVPARRIALGHFSPEGSCRKSNTTSYVSGSLLPAEVHGRLVCIQRADPCPNS